MRYPLHHRETLRAFEQLNRAARRSEAAPEPPRLRRLDLTPVSDNGTVSYVLTDPERISPRALALTAAGVKVLQLLDGSRSLDQIAAQAAAIVPASDTPERVRQLVQNLSASLFLFDTAYRSAVIELVGDFARLRERAPIAMGSSYPDDGAAAREQVLGYLDGHQPPAGKLRGLIAPHIDYQRGHLTYGKAYGALRGLTGVRRFVILGTAHNRSFRRFTATRKHYRTALGTTVTDSDFLGRLARTYPYPLFEDEFLHRGEHSIELNLPFLQALFGPDVAVVPILCGSQQDLFAERRDPLADPETAAFIAALRQTIAESAGDSVVIAAADLSHMGPHFGDQFIMDEERLARLRRDDQALIDRLAAADAAGFFAALSKSNNATRVCGAAPIYALLQVLGPDVRIEVRGYEQCTDPERFTTVTIPAAAVVDGD